MQTVVVFLSIASVLACPYECAVQLAAARTIGSGHSSACCEQCGPHETADFADTKTPQPAGPDEDGRSCFCEGAVFDAGARSVVDDTLEVSLWTWVSGSAETLEIVAPMPSSDRAGLPPPLDGRLTRIAMRSLLL